MHSLLSEFKNTAHIGATEFKAINWLPTKNRIDQCVCVNVTKFFNGTAPAYSAEIFHPANLGRITRRSKFKLEFPFRKSTAGQKCLSYLGPKIWNSLPSDLKSAENPNTFKHKIKENFFQKIQIEEDDIYVFYYDPSSSLPTMSLSHKPCFVLITTTVLS